MSACGWASSNEEMQRYHDTEWGEPVHDDWKMFEHLMMECLQCGLSWNTVLQKRPILRACFADFDFDAVAAFTETDVERIMVTPGMIRSRRKIDAVIRNAQCYQRVREECGSFCAYLWAFTDGKTILYDEHDRGLIPASNGLSARIAKDLKARGFTYVGPVTVYAHLQACGLINDHIGTCPCYARINAEHPTVRLPLNAEKNVVQFA